MYKLTRPDGFDFYSGTINYRDAIGTIIRVTDFDLPEVGSCGKGLHASRNPNDCFVGASIPCAAFRVKGIRPIAKDNEKTRYQALKVLEEIEDLDNLFGWKYSEIINLIDPFEIEPPIITREHIELLKKWANVMHSMSKPFTRATVMTSMKTIMKRSIWNAVQDSMGNRVWASVWKNVWERVWETVWASVWDNNVMSSVGDSAWAYIGSLFPNIKKLKHTGIKNKSGVYYFQPAADLWKMGLVPGFDEKTWRLFGGKKASVLYEASEEELIHHLPERGIYESTK